MSYFVVTMWGSLPPFAMLGCNSRLSWLENKMGKRRRKDGRKEGGGREGGVWLDNVLLRSRVGECWKRFG